MHRHHGVCSRGGKVVGRLQEQERATKCSICKHGETESGHVTVTLERGGTIVVIKNVPAQVCQDCGEYYLDQPTTERVLGQAEDAVRRNAEMEVLRYAA